ncbi:MAG: hypothetical protein JXB35_10365 [Anaerolineae bacterium]|nr:hypothetical protein [Anaerolineae bacterium]
MSDEKTEGHPESSEAWREVGQQFKSLGDSIAAAFRSAWEDEGNRQHVEELRDGLQSLVNEVGQAISDGAASPEGRRARAEAERAAQSAHEAVKKSWTDVEPHVISSLEKVSAELRRAIDGLKSGPSGSSTPDGEGTV